MELLRKRRQRPVNTNSAPTNYKEMEDWLNDLSFQEWIALLGAYANGGTTGLIEYMKNNYQNQLRNWKGKDLKHFWVSRKWEDFKSKTDRIVVV